MVAIANVIHWAMLGTHASCARVSSVLHCPPCRLLLPFPQGVSAEIVVTFEASSELGDTFMARQSYLPSEIHWGHTFVNIIKPPQPPDTQAEVDLSRFHDVEPQPGLGDEMTMPHRLSRRVVAGGSSGAGAVVPGRLLCENTLVLSEDAVVTCRNGRPYLMFRLGDTFPGHVVDVTVRAAGQGRRGGGCKFQPKLNQTKLAGEGRAGGRSQGGGGMR